VEAFLIDSAKSRGARAERRRCLFVIRTSDGKREADEAAAVSPSTFASNFFLPAGLYREIYGEGAGDGRQKLRNFVSVSSVSRFPRALRPSLPLPRHASFRPIGARRLLKRPPRPPVGSSVGFASGFVPETVISLSRGKREKKDGCPFEYQSRHYAVTRARSILRVEFRSPNDSAARRADDPSLGNSQGRRRAATNNISASVISPRVSIRRCIRPLRFVPAFLPTPVWRFCESIPSIPPAEMDEIIPSARIRSTFSRFVIPTNATRLRVSRECNPGVSIEARDPS